jgi:hypothetical protein
MPATLKATPARGEDKIAKKAKLAQLEPMEIVQKYTVGFQGCNENIEQPAAKY